MEPAIIRKYPLGMLYHQTMSVVLSMGEVPLPVLEKRILGMACFSHISSEDFRMLIDHLLALDHLQLTDDRGHHRPERNSLTGSWPYSRGRRIR